MGIKILTVLLLILKIFGMTLLILLGILLVLLLIVLFVPVRYQGSGSKKEGDPVPVYVQLKATWMLRIVRVSFIYPEEAFLKVRVLFFQILPVGKKKKRESIKKKDNKGCAGPEAGKTSGQRDPDTENIPDQKPDAECAASNAEDKDLDRDTNRGEESSTLPDFIRKLFSAIRNIKYTIRKIYDKIRHIIRNIRYYINILQTESFKRAFILCKEQLFRLLKTVLPRKVSGTFTIGMEDPAATGQILSTFGILYPLIGESITVIPDFEKPVIEGSFRFKGKITVFILIRIAARFYFHKDLKRVIRLFKKEAVQNGRE